MGIAVRAAVVLLIWMATTSGLAAQEVIERVLAVVGGDVILLSDVRVARDLGLVVTTGAADPDRTALSALIDRALMLSEVERYAPREPLPADIDRAFAEVRDRVGSLNALSEVLRRAGLDERQLRETLRQNLRIRSYLAQRFAADTPARVQLAIDEWLASLRRRTEIVDVGERR